MEELADYIDESKEVYNANKFVVGLQKRIKDFPKQHVRIMNIGDGLLMALID